MEKIETLKGLKEGETYWVSVGTQENPRTLRAVAETHKHLHNYFPKFNWVVMPRDIEIMDNPNAISKKKVREAIEKFRQKINAPMDAHIPIDELLKELGLE